MKSRTLRYALFIALIFVSVQLFAQKKTDEVKKAGGTDKKVEKTDNKEDTKEKNQIDKETDPTKLYVDLSVKAYLEWGHFWGFNYDGSTEWDRHYRWGANTSALTFANNFNTSLLTGTAATNYSKKNNDTFRVQRAYITIRKRIGKIFSFKLTTDIDPTGLDFIHLKYAFIQVNWGYGPFKIKGQFGKIGTPVVGITEKLSDLRWIRKDFMTDAKFLLNGKSFDNTADLGAMISINLFKMFTVEYALTNGEGYKKDGNETYDGKSHTVVISANPIKHTYINLYGRWEDTNKNEWDITDTANPVKLHGVENRWYWGFGVAWASDLIKGGVNFFMPEKHFQQTVYPVNLISGAPAITSFVKGHKEQFYLLDSWININLGAITPAGVLIVGRAAWGKELPSLVGNYKESRETLVLAAGAGYQFSKHLRLLLYYEHTGYTISSNYVRAFIEPLRSAATKVPTRKAAVYIKAEAKF